jgi:uncharacterized protein
MTQGFCWYQLRTTDSKAAQAFYTHVAGLAIQEEAGRLGVHLYGQLVGEIVPLPERAAAQGAPSHWLGHLSVSNLEATLQRFVALGGERLGPLQRASDGSELAILRDPFGSVLALSASVAPKHGARLAWHELHTQDQQRAFSTYRELFGFQQTEAVDLGPPLGTYQMFSWEEGAGSVGGMLSSARSPMIHPHWLFYFAVDDLDRALAQTVSLGGSVVFGPVVMPNGARAAQCEDPQRAAFALQETPPPARS